MNSYLNLQYIAIMFCLVFLLVLWGSGSGVYSHSGIWLCHFGLSEKREVLMLRRGGVL